MSCMSQNFRLFHVSNLSVRNFRIFLLIYTGSLVTDQWPSRGSWPSLGIALKMGSYTYTLQPLAVIRSASNWPNFPFFIPWLCSGLHRPKGLIQLKPNTQKNRLYAYNIHLTYRLRYRKQRTAEHAWHSALPMFTLKHTWRHRNYALLVVLCRFNLSPLASRYFCLLFRWLSVAFRGIFFQWECCRCSYLFLLTFQNFLFCILLLRVSFDPRACTRNWTTFIFIQKRSIFTCWFSTNLWKRFSRSVHLCLLGPWVLLYRF